MNKEPENKNQTTDFLKTDRGKTKSNTIEIPSISLPKGGGAIKGIDEKFSVNAVNGTASFSIPLPFSSARGASPALNLTYNSGSGNGIFGLGWSLNLSSIKRKTDKELPKYVDSIDSDTYLFSEAEDLVPEFKKVKKIDDSIVFELDANGNYILFEKDSPDGKSTIRFYKPRIEGLFARIEKWVEKASGIIKWRVITKENVTTLFGWSPDSRIADPEDSNKIFEWLPEFVFDDKGNCSHYIYKKDDSLDFTSSHLHNRNRIKNGNITYTSLYLEKVLYGNKTPYKKFNDPIPPEADYFFQTIFDYGEYNTNAPYDKINNWDFRKDAFSDYKAGFEIRTTRLCKRILLFHHFTGPNEYDGLVKSLNFEYDTSIAEDFTFLTSITSFGYIKKPDGTYTNKSLPPIKFEYQKHEWNKDVRQISIENLIHAPVGLDEQEYQFTDLFNEGLSGILTEQGEGWFYEHNLSNGKFAQAKLVSPKPSFTGLGAQLQLMDLDADGGKQLVSLKNEPKGYFELSDEEEWQPFRNFENLPSIHMGDSYTRMLDLNNDGKPEALITKDNVFTWYESDGRKGFKPALTTVKPYNEEEGPHMVFADPEQTIFLADMSGDGLTDIVRIRNKEICYWPNLGYGNFGAKVAMDNAPCFDYEGSFNPAYLRLADIDGSGTTDIIYLGKNKFTCWLNLSGNSFSTKPFEIDNFPEIHNHAKISVTDLLGNGVACIVWSSSLNKDSQAPLKYVDLMNSKKPHIMVFYKNNLGKEVSLEYTPSTKFYIDDKQEGKPWVTKLHFPVHCISKTETRDKISGYRFVSSYKYHHGYYDHAEREFRGFGMIEQIDAEDFEHWVKGNASNIVEQDLHQEPVITKTWFHTGAFLGKEKILNQFAHEYWYEEMKRQGFPVVNFEVTLPEAQIIAAPGLNPSILEKLNAQEWQEALRTCKSMTLRSEVFAKDAKRNGNTQDAIKKELTPYSVATHNCVIELIQPKGQNKHAIFVVKESEAITYNYERNTEDPLIAHTLNIKLDEYGNILESASVVYPRLKPDASLPDETKNAQNKTSINYAENQYTNDIHDEDSYRLRLLCEVKTYELKGVSKPNSIFTLSDFDNILNTSTTIEYHEINKEPAIGVSQKRLIEHIRTVYLSNDCKTPLSIGSLDSLALPYESYQLAYTPALINDIFGARVDAALMTEGKFTHSEGDSNWWIRSGTIQFKYGAETPLAAQNRFYVPISYTDPFGAITKVKYYSNYFLFIKETEDAVGNTASVDFFNFRTLSPQRMKDANDNFSEAITDELGLVKAMAVFGKGNEADELKDLFEYKTTADDYSIKAFLANDKVYAYNPVDSDAKDLLKSATARFVYDFDTYKTSGKPAVIASIVREEHSQKNNNSPVLLSFEYSNGLGQVVMKKVQAKPGKACKSNGDGTTSQIDTTPNLRWIGNGRIILNNKGNPVKQYEPYFSTTHLFEDEKELVECGVTPIMYYDAPGRLIKTELPDGTFTKVEFDSWKQINYDQNDTVLETDWYKNRINRSIDAALIALGKDPVKEKEAANKAAIHANTPVSQHLDTLGRPVLQIDHNGKDNTNDDILYYTKVDLDIEGNIRSVTDARDRIVMLYKYDMLGNKVYQKSMEAGQRWLLVNILGQPLRTWDERNHEFQYFYDDPLHRPTHSIIIGGDGTVPLNNIFDRTFYGESMLTGIRTDTNRYNEAALQAINVLGKPIKSFDTGGVVEAPQYDFKGQPVSTTRRLFKNYKATANWIDANLLNDLEADLFTFITETDALGRITRQIAPDKSIIIPVYNEAGLLNGEKVNHFNVLTNNYEGVVEYIKDIDYNEKGQRSKIIYGNNVVTNLYYDKYTFRLKRLESFRHNGNPLQDWYYTSDPVGNITHIEDKNIPVIFFDNQKVSGVSEYTYDALYRLVRATGRENNEVLKFGTCDNWNDKPFIHEMNPGDPMAVRDYTQSYIYDAVGNIMEMKHLAAGGNWTRSYEYEIVNNRLKRTNIGDNGNPANYTKYKHHTKHGFLEELPHLEKVAWNFKEEVILTSRQHCTDDKIPVITYYQYDGSGQRIRKITENQVDAGADPTKKEERIYISGYELYKKHTGTDAGLERTTLSLMDEGQRFAMIETRNEVDDGTIKQLTRYQLHNHLGSAALEMNNNAEVISYEEYHPFGTTAFHAKNKIINAVAKRYRYTGMERDEETGLEYHSARYYMPWLGRWLSPDPAGLVDGTNVFSYSCDNPLMNIDLNGSQCDPSIATCPELMENWSYGTPVPNRSSVGQNVQRDHPIQVNLRSEQRGGRYNRSVSAARGELTVLVETGRGRFHTELGRLQAEINARVRSGLITSQSELIEATREAYRIAGEATKTKVNKRALDRAIISNLATLSETYKQTLSELEQSGGPASTVTESSINLTFCDPDAPQHPKASSTPESTIQIAPKVSSTPQSTPQTTPKAVPKESQPIPQAEVASPAPPKPAMKPPTQGSLARAAAWTVVAVPKGLRLLGQVVTVYGAAVTGTRVHQETGNPLWGAVSTLVSIPAGAIDDAAMALNPALAGLVFESWEKRGAGPSQSAVGEGFIQLDKLGRRVFGRWW